MAADRKTGVPVWSNNGAFNDNNNSSMLIST